MSVEAYLLLERATKILAERKRRTCREVCARNDAGEVISYAEDAAALSLDGAIHLAEHKLRQEREDMRQIHTIRERVVGEIKDALRSGNPKLGEFTTLRQLNDEVLWKPKMSARRHKQALTAVCRNALKKMKKHKEVRVYLREQSRTLH